MNAQNKKIKEIKFFKLAKDDRGRREEVGTVIISTYSNDSFSFPSQIELIVCRRGSKL